MTGSKQDKSYKLMFVDISRDHFHSPSRRQVFVALLPERETASLCGLLLKSMYGTRDAATNFEAVGRHGHIDEYEIRGWKSQAVLVQTRKQRHQTVLPRRRLRDAGG